jgi:putative glutamine amidotransferase
MTTTSRRPLIGITMDSGDKPTSIQIFKDYVIAVDKAGGIPFPLPFIINHALIPGLVDRLDGVIFSGGNDLNPAAWGETYEPDTKPIEPMRQEFEFALMAEVEKRRMPTLGICLGSQVMNVYRGGSLIQFLPRALGEGSFDHRVCNDRSRRHPVKVAPDSTVAKVAGKSELSVNTRHKQAVKTVGKGLRAFATAMDGTIEGVEDPSLPFFVGVQWHPENLHDQPEHLAIFKALIEKAGIKNR